MKGLLFISGFNTYADEQIDNLDVYECFNQYFKYSDYKITFFRYKTCEPLDDVYKRLCVEVVNPEYVTLVGHSLGGGLLMKYLSEHDELRKVILLMPFISVPKWKQIAFSYLDTIPVALRLPKWLAIPNSGLFDGGNILNDSAMIINLSQITYAINHLLLPDDVIVNVFEKTKDIIMVYADDETISPIDCGLLDKIQKKVFVKGKHVSFADVISTKLFFDVFTPLL